MSSKMQLTMRSGPTPGAVFKLVGDQITIGRDSSNDIAINDAEPSRRHARLSYQGGKYVIEDLGSTKGTFVNGQRLTGPRVLKSGEVISIGELIVFLYEATELDSFGNPSNKQINRLIKPTGINDKKAYLTMRSGPTPGAVFELVGDQIIIGRDSSNEIPVNDAEVSRKHTRFTLQGGKYVIEDLGSTNGTFVNGQRLTGPRVLKSGEVVSLGEQNVFVYEITSEKRQEDIRNSRSNIVQIPAKRLEDIDSNTSSETVQLKTDQKRNILSRERIYKATKKESPPVEASPLKVFISYSRKDLNFVRKLAKDLSLLGTNPWWDLSKIKGGDTWIRSIQSALDSSHCCIVVITPDSIQSPWVEREYTYAFNNDIKVIPIYLKSVERFPFSFSTIHYIDFRHNRYSIAINDLKIALETKK